MRTIIPFAVFLNIFCLGCNNMGPQYNTPPVLTVKVSPGSATLAVGGQQQFSATVTGSSNTAVTWSLAGIACSSGPGCGSITQGGLYTAPSFVPSPNQFTVQADSQANALYFGTADVVITAGPVPALRGAYAFILLGADADGPVSLAGTFEADGADHIRSGELTLCHEVSNCTRLAFEGSYKTNVKERGEIVVDVLPDAILHFAPAENRRLMLALDGKNNLHAVGTMTILAGGSGF